MRYNPPNRIFKKASEISEADIIPTFVGNDMIQFEFKSNSGPNNIVNIDEYGLWTCTCENYQFSKSEYGEYCCKHIIATIHYIMTHDLVAIINDDKRRQGDLYEKY